MKFERSFMNWTEGLGICCWEAPSTDSLAALFDEVGSPWETMVEVEEHAAESTLL